MRKARGTKCTGKLAHCALTTARTLPFLSTVPLSQNDLATKCVRLPCTEQFSDSPTPAGVLRFSSALSPSIWREPRPLRLWAQPLKTAHTSGARCESSWSSALPTDWLQMASSQGPLLGFEK